MFTEGKQFKICPYWEKIDTSNLRNSKNIEEFGIRFKEILEKMPNNMVFLFGSLLRPKDKIKREYFRKCFEKIRAQGENILDTSCLWGFLKKFEEEDNFVKKIENCIYKVILDSPKITTFYIFPWDIQQGEINKEMIKFLP